MPNLTAMLSHVLPKQWVDELKHRRHYARLRRHQLAISSDRIASVGNRAKVVYALTPPPDLSNIGDHAQVVAIREWIGRIAPGKPILEVDKNDCIYCLPELCEAIGPDDLILLHSGGNLGDRGIWSERARRNVIRTFPGNPIVSLPQTIHFSETPYGRHQRKVSCDLYAKHPNLTIVGRDHRSGELAEELFPRATTKSMPDFVLSLSGPSEPEVGQGTLVCLRNDPESALTRQQREHLHQLIPEPKDEYDTTIDEPIIEDQRKHVLEKTLAYFSGFESVVTDRYHGLIFAVLCRRPTVVLGTVDHKLTSAFDWFEGIRGLRFANSVEEVPALREAVIAEGFSGAPDWNAKYFDPFGEQVQRVAQRHAPAVWTG